MFNIECPGEFQYGSGLKLGMTKFNHIRPQTPTQGDDDGEEQVGKPQRCAILKLYKTHQAEIHCVLHTPRRTN